MGNEQGSPIASQYRPGRLVPSSASSLLQLFEGEKVDQPGERVSIFVFDPSKVSSDGTAVLSNLFSESMKLGKPGYDGLLRVLATEGSAATSAFSLGGGSEIRIITESVTPLSEILKERELSQDELIVGLLQILVSIPDRPTNRSLFPFFPLDLARVQQTLETLRDQQPPLFHSNLSINSVFVSNKTLSWKLGFEWAFALGQADQWSLMTTTLALQDTASVPPELANAPATRPSNYPLHAKDAWGLGSLLSSIPSAAPILKQQPWNLLQSPVIGSRPDPIELQNNKVFTSCPAARALSKLLKLRKDERQEATLFKSIVSDLKGAKIDSQTGRALVHQLLKASLITRPAAIDAKLTQLILTPGRGGLLSSSADFARHVRPFVEWAWKLEQHPLRTELRAVVCQHLSFYIDTLDPRFIESEIQGRIMGWMRHYREDAHSAMYAPDAAAAWISYVLGSSRNSGSSSLVPQIKQQQLKQTAQSMAAEMLRLLVACENTAFRKRIIIATSSLMHIDHDWGNEFYDNYSSLTAVDPSAALRRFATFRAQKFISEDSPASRRITMDRLVNYFLSPAVNLLTDMDPSVRDRARRAIRKYTLVLEKLDPQASVGATSGLKSGRKNRGTNASNGSVAAGTTASPSRDGEQKNTSFAPISFDWSDEEDEESTGFEPVSPPSKPKPAAQASPKKAPAAKKSSNSSKIQSTIEPVAATKPAATRMAPSEWDDWDSDWNASASKKKQDPVAPIATKQPTKHRSTFEDDEDEGESVWGSFDTDSSYQTTTAAATTTSSVAAKTAVPSKPAATVPEEPTRLQAVKITSFDDEGGFGWGDDGDNTTLEDKNSTKISTKPMSSWDQRPNTAPVTSSVKSSAKVEDSSAIKAALSFDDSTAAGWGDDEDGDGWGAPTPAVSSAPKPVEPLEEEKTEQSHSVPDAATESPKKALSLAEDASDSAAAGWGDSEDEVDFSSVKSPGVTPHTVEQASTPEVIAAPSATVPEEQAPADEPKAAEPDFPDDLSAELAAELSTEIAEAAPVASTATTKIAPVAADDDIMEWGDEDDVALPTSSSKGDNETSSKPATSESETAPPSTDGRPATQPATLVFGDDEEW